MEKLILLPILILLVVAAAILLIRLFRPRFAYFWLVAALGALAAWPATLVLRLYLPSELRLVTWQPQALFPVSPALLLDRISWPFALAITTLVVAVILTDVARAAEADWLSWAGSLGLGGLGLTAVLAGNPLTLVIAWSALDLIELVVLLSQISESAVRERVVIAFAARVGGILVLLMAAVTANSAKLPLDFSTIPAAISIYLIIASGLRLGVLPLHLPFLQELPLRRGLGTLVRLVPAAASLVLLVRTGTEGVPSSFRTPLLALSGLAAISASLIWATARDELDGRPFWILGGASFAVAAAIQAHPGGSLAWGIATLLSGGLLFLFSARSTGLLVIPALSWIAFSGLPLTPNWMGSYLYAERFSPWLVLFLLAQVLMLLGYIRHALRPEPDLRGVERWVRLIYPLGLVLLVVSQAVIAFWGRLYPDGSPQPFPSPLESWPGLVAVLAVGASIALINRGLVVDPARLYRLRSVFSFSWFYNILWGGYRTIRRLITFITTILEGEGGILWTLFLLIVLLSLFAQRSRGG